MSIYISGIGVSKGIAIGEAHLIARETIDVTKETLPASEIRAEIRRFKRALKLANSQLHDIKKKIAQNTADDILVFIDTHLLMLEDPAFDEGTIANIKRFSCNAEWALQIQGERLVQVFDEMEDPYLRTRKDDVLHVVKRIQTALLGQSEDSENISYKGKIIVADDLTPADTIMMQHQKIAGFITEYGGPLSHTAILARNLGIPAIVGLHHARSLIHRGETLIIDGLAGTVINSPGKKSLKYYRAVRRDEIAKRNLLNELSGKPAITLDGKQITLHGNIDKPADIRTIKKYDDTGVGLYRTEMLFIELNQWPDQQTHLKTYKRAVKALKGKPLTIRTMDLGADKEIQDTIDHGPMAHNPAMGLRAIRRCLKEPQDFMPQLLAILRASAFGPVRIMIPMLTSTNELTQVLALIEDAKEILKKKKIAFDKKIPVGAMIEVPAAALAADAFASKLDFLSIGTNDLIQYTLAIDRIDDEVNYLFNPLHPAVLRLIQMTIDAGKKAGIPVSMCGEMASDTSYTRLLLGMGLEYFSVQANALLEVKHIIVNSKINNLQDEVKQIMQIHDSDEITSRVQQLVNLL
ncbi:MAG: phosphoenolpyruvate--protein phosphotransferase [Gammaproteobacteria bacterium]|nr:phosphoenolpyruvate--protein phosphotransferase [Gammaproteobacteria bacterium]NNJ49968.1 phosphoenolpyruvate--protein phosphotransferase [Gammaproteobacteria bacterium]